MTPLPVWFHELVIAPAALALAFVHARRALGASRALLELGALMVYGFLLERTAIAVFRSHLYATSWRAAPGGVPLAVAAVWAALISSAIALAARLGAAPGLARGAVAALIGINLDLLMEPVAVRAGLWQWTPAGPWLGVPIGNFVGWGVIVASYAAGAERWPAGRQALAAALRRLALALGSIAALVAVGLAWRRLALEGLFGGGRAWLAWGALLAATWSAGRRRLGEARTTAPADGLAAGGAGLPLAVFSIVGAAFAANGLITGDPLLALVAVASLATLAWIGRGALLE